MLWHTLVFAAAVEAQGGFAGLNHLRFGCSQIVVERIDPLVNPGMIPTPHMHQVVGGNAFNASMPTGVDISSVATCTTCGPADDRSNYWTANLYFKARNGTYKRVPQVPNRYVRIVRMLWRLRDRSLISSALFALNLSEILQVPVQ
jgi:hypothetical protein